MDVDFTRAFNKQFEKLIRKKQDQVRQAVALFLQDTATPSLHNHGLTGEWQGFRSIRVGGDLRLHFRVITDNRVLFVAVGSHSQLYK
ncbi:MAG: type II toxin-antitoxin system mRNA interferase toxin, RelE/StbE family [Candidatus Saccharimonadales bacterium]